MKSLNKNLNNSDKSYKIRLAEEIGLNAKDYKKLNSIIGENELKILLKQAEEKNFMLGNRLDLTKMDAFDDDFIKSGDFRINLHIHTTHSDGKLTVGEVLDQAAEYGNFLAKLNRAPFLIAITDHDCIDGAKEALYLVASNPEKYKNVRIVLGVELSAITNKLKNIKKPILIHTHMFCINPFDKNFNELVNKKRTLKKQLATKTLTVLNKKLEKILEKYNFKFNLDDFGKIHPLILKGEDEICIPTKKFAISKLCFAHYVLKNPAITDILKAQGVDIKNLKFEDVILNYKTILRQPGGVAKNYRTALKCYLEAQCGGVSLPIDNILSEESSELNNAISEAANIGAEAHPSLSYMPEAFYEFESTLKTLSEQEFGVFSVAHPARTVIADVSGDYYEFFYDMFAAFKKYGGQKAQYYEGFYQSYFGEAYTELISPIELAVKNFSLLKAGGLDTHGSNIKLRGADA